jgi:hypothetical protein
MHEDLHRLWLRVQEPMAHSVIDFFVYLAVAGMGLALVLDPPRRCASKTGVTSKTRKVGTPMNSRYDRRWSDGVHPRKPLP